MRYLWMSSFFAVFYSETRYTKKKKKYSKVILNIENKYLVTIYVLKITISGVI